MQQVRFAVRLFLTATTDLPAGALMTDSSEQEHISYSAPIDGMRAIAILAVMVFHVWPVALNGGFTGVDVFFVLSGFLIGSIVLQDIREGHFSFREFYLRRIQRLLPNIIVTVLTVLFLWKVLLPPGSAAQPAVHSIWTLLNVSNFYIWKDLGDYWGNAAEWAPLTHTWSLGVEEQFYLFFPFFLILLARFQPRRISFWLSVTSVCSFGMCLQATNSHPTAAFYLMPMRVWELLLGAILAAHRDASRAEGIKQHCLGGLWAQEAIGVIGLGMIACGFFIIDEGRNFPGLISLLPTVGTVFVLLAVVDENTRISRLLSVPFLVGTGRLSYSLYLWHWPLIILGKIEADLHELPQLAGAVAGDICGIMLSCAAYAFVERPLRNRGPGRSRRLVTIAIGYSVAIACCWCVATRRTAADQLHRFDMLAFYGQLYDAGGPGNPNPASATRYSDVYFPHLANRPNDAWRRGGVVHLFGGGRPQVVVLGSSHALMYSRLVDDICRKMRLSVAFLGVDRTPAFFETTANSNFASPLEAHEFDDTRKKWLRDWRPEAIFVIDRWDLRIGKLQDVDVKLRSFLREVSPVVGRVIFVAQVPVLRVGPDVNLRAFIAQHQEVELSLPRLKPDSYEPLRRQIVAIAETATRDFPKLRILRVDLPFYREDGSIRFASGRSFFYADNNHLTDRGSEFVRGLFENAIAEAHAGASSR